MTKTNGSKLNFTNARLRAVQALYAHQMGDEDWDKVMSRFLLGELGTEALIDENRQEKYITLPEADSELLS